MTNKEAANELKNYHREDGSVPTEILLAIDALESIDSLAADLQSACDMLRNRRNKGHWTFAGFCFSTIQYKCSKCKLNNLEKTDFCPNCGANMRKEGTNENESL